MKGNVYYVYAYLRVKDSAGGKAGTPYYIGKGKGFRAFQKKRKFPCPDDLRYLHFIAENLREPDAFQIEILYIYLHGRIDLGTGILRNGTNGGEGASGQIKSESERKAIGDRSRGRKVSEEARQKLRNALKGRTIPDEIIKKIADSNRGQKRTEEFKEKRRGIPRPEEVRAKIKNTLIGHKHSPETLEKIISKRRAAVITPEWRKKMSEAQYRRHGKIPVEKDFHGIPSRYEAKRLSRETQGQQDSLALPISQS